ncbi:hypothetical protein SNK04_014245 [Fusarium graminearum]
MTLDSAVLGPGRTITASAATFMPSDVGREIETDGGVAMVTAYTSATAVTVDVLTPFPSLTIPAGEWVITGSPFTTLTPSWSGGTGNEQPAVGAVITLTLAQGGWRADDVGKWVDLNAGLVQITAVTSPTVATGVAQNNVGSGRCASLGVGPDGRCLGWRQRISEDWHLLRTEVVGGRVTSVPAHHVGFTHR